MSTIIIAVSLFIALEKKSENLRNVEMRYHAPAAIVLMNFLAYSLHCFSFLLESTGKPHISLMPFLNCMSIILHSKQMHCVLYEISYLVLSSLSLIKKHP